MTETPTTELSERELEILRLLATGASNKDIAQRLVISPNTVKVHLRNIFAKIGVVSRTEATLYALQHGMSTLEMPPGSTAPVVAGSAAETNPPQSGVVNHNNPSSFGSFYSISNLAQNVTTSKPRLNWAAISLFLAAILGLIALTAIGVRSILIRQLQPTPDQPDINQQLLTRWSSGAALPDARQGLAAVSYEDSIYVVGGTTVQGVTGRVDQYSPLQNTWHELAAKPIPVTDISAAILGEKIYIPGGKMANGKPTDVVEVYDPRRNTWERTSSLPVPISGYAMAPFEGKIYLFGGWDGKDYLSSVYEYDPEQDKWQLRTPMSSARAFAGAAVMDNKIFVIGGFNGSIALSSNEAYYPQRDQDNEIPWETRARLPEGRYRMGVAGLADSIYVVGGSSAVDYPNEEYSPQSDSWVPFENSPAQVGIGAGLVPFENRIYIFGGGESEKLSASNQIYQAIYTVVFPIIQK